MHINGIFKKDDLNATLNALGPDVFFVQIGAMDGVSYDPIHPFVKRLGWKGLLVEPLADMFETLRANYAGCPGLSFVNAAVADYDGTIEMTRIDPQVIHEKLLARGVLGISTLMPDRGVIGGNHNLPPEALEVMERYKRTLEVPCLTLSTLLAREKVQKIDLFVVDTEGADWMVTRQLDLKTYRPRLVYIEYNHLSAYEKTACIYHFRNHGYRVYIDACEQENFLAIAA